MAANINQTRHHSKKLTTMKKEPKIISVFKYRNRHITTYEDGTVSFSGMTHESFESAKKKIDLIENNLMIGRIK